MIDSLKDNPLVAALARRYHDRGIRDLEQAIFVATTGRSGTLTLVDVFSRLPGCVALHEPYPAMHAEVLRRASHGDTVWVDRFYASRKAVNIRRDARGARYYLEANHLFIKTFADQALRDFGERARVIHLVRDPLGVAHSIYRLQDPPGTPQGNLWWLDYRAPGNRIAIADTLDSDPEYRHPFYRGLWYWFEVELRVRELRERQPRLPVVPFATEGFNSPEALAALFDGLGIPVGEEALAGMTHRRKHERAHQKRGEPLPEAEQIARLGRFAELLEDRGYALPESFGAYDRR